MHIALLVFLMLMPFSPVPEVRVPFRMQAVSRIFDPISSALPGHLDAFDLFGVGKIDVEECSMGQGMVDYVLNDGDDKMLHFFVIGIHKVDAGKSDSWDIAENSLDHATHR